MFSQGSQSNPGALRSVAGAALSLFGFDEFVKPPSENIAAFRGTSSDDQIGNERMKDEEIMKREDCSTGPSSPSASNPMKHEIPYDESNESNDRLNNDDDDDDDGNYDDCCYDDDMSYYDDDEILCMPKFHSSSSPITSNVRVDHFLRLFGHLF